MQISKRSMWLTLVAMTLANSMILVDQTAVPLATPDVVEGLGADLGLGQWLLTANILPLAALMVLGGRLGDLLGMRRVFLAGAVIFLVSTALAGGAQDIVWMITVRATQGVGAALMMPTAMALVSAVFPDERRGSALGILAGASAFFAACGPVLGGLLTSIDWRLVFWINVPLAALTILITLRHTPEPLPEGRPADRSTTRGGHLRARDRRARLRLQPGPAAGMGERADPGPARGRRRCCSVLFVFVERRAKEPLIKFSLLRHLNFLASIISQVLAGMVELGLGFLLPFFLLLVVGVSPAVAGIALIPGTLPIILAGPLAGRLFDKVGGRIPLVAGFLILAASGAALALGAGEASAVALIPGLLLQGLGLGIVLTVNDPTGLTAVPDDDAGEAAGMINTAEQMGGALGIAILTALELGYYFNQLNDTFDKTGFHPSEKQYDKVRDFIVEAEQRGLNNVPEDSKIVRLAHDYLINSHIDAFQVTFVASAGIAVLGAIACFVLVRRTHPRRRGPDLRPPLALDLRQHRPHAGDHEAPASAG